MSGFRLAIRGRPCRPQPHAEDSEERGVENAIPVTSPTPPRPRPGSWRPALPPRAGRIFLRIDQPNKFRMSAPLGHACGSQDATRDGLTKSSDEADRKSRTCVNASRLPKTVRFSLRRDRWHSNQHWGSDEASLASNEFDANPRLRLPDQTATAPDIVRLDDHGKSFRQDRPELEFEACSCMGYVENRAIDDARHAKADRA